MAIVDMSVFTLISPVTKREELLKELQRFEYVHFKDLADLDEELTPGHDALEEAHIEENSSKISFILDQLRPYDTRPQGLKANLVARPAYDLSGLEEKRNQIDEEKFFEEVKDLSDALDKVNQDILRKENLLEELEPWLKLDSELAQFEETDSTVIVMGTVPRRFEASLGQSLLDYPDVYFKKVSEGGGLVYGYFIYLKENRQELEDLLRGHGFSQQDSLGDKSPKEERKELGLGLQALAKEKEQIEEALTLKAKDLEQVEVLYEYYENEKLINRAKDNFVGTSHMDILSGYVPTDKLEEFEEAASKCLGDDFYLEAEEADRDGDIPILLENNKIVDSFSGITTMFAMPKYNEVDPTPLMAPFYWLFFGMMGADLGYGLVLFALTALVLKFVPLQDVQKNLIKFFFYLSISLVCWGLVFGSFFGGLIPMNGLIDTSVDFTLLLVLSIVLGAIHLYFGLGIQGYMLVRDGKYLDAVYDVLTWVMALTGGIALLLAMSLGLPPIIGTIGKWVMIIGMVGIVLFAGRESESTGGRLGMGFYELYGISSYVGDFVSYSRLMALGLSGGFIALSINIIVDMVIHNGIFGFVAGIVIFVVFHIFNIFLSLLSAYVHTSRLTYVEFFGKFYEGGGRAFELFKTDPKYIDIKNTQGGKQ